VALLMAVDFLLLIDIYPMDEKLLAAIQNQGQYFLVNNLEATCFA
jgi:hypothetical protein